MAFKGFIKDSKSYMNYPNCNRVKFWLAFPRACFRYNYFMLRHKLRNVKIGNPLTAQKRRKCQKSRGLINMTKSKMLR